MGNPVLPQQRMRSGHYEVLDRFAVGAMAELFLGHARGEEGFEKLVVIKRLLPRLAEDTRFVQMLQIEARIHASLSHKNIVQIHDLGVSGDGEYFIVLEYVDGRDLGALLDRNAKTIKPGAPKRIDDAVGLYIMAEVAEGVHFAHEMRAGDGNPLGLVHRDISPSNILLSYAGEVKVSDFGVAKRNTDSSVVTSLKGELGYISPEQARGAPVDRRSDIFSLGAVAFEIFTGSPLRTLTGSPDDYLKAASGIVAAPTRYRPDIPPAIERLLTMALAPDPRDRFQDARKFIDACREALATVARPNGGEATELKNLLLSLLPPGARAHNKSASKVISLMPSLWEDVTVPEAKIPDVPVSEPPPQTPAQAAVRAASQPVSSAPGTPPGSTPERPSTRLPSQAPRPSQPLAAASSAVVPPSVTPGSPRTPGRATSQARPPWVSGTTREVRKARKHHNLAWALLIMLVLAASTLVSIHLYVMPLPVAAVYFRPAFMLVHSDPPAADVYVDGKKVLAATPAEIEIRRDHADHTVELRKDGFQPARQALRYDQQVRLELSLKLVPEHKPAK
jgi:eukaryotic-like serine/threonine-protein kinase